MAAPNEQVVVNGNLISLQLVEGQTDAFLVIRGSGPVTPPARISLKPMLEGGLTERQALQHTIRIIEVAVRAVTS